MRAYKNYKYNYISFILYAHAQSVQKQCAVQVLYGARPCFQTKNLAGEILRLRLVASATQFHSAAVRSPGGVFAL